MPQYDYLCSSCGYSEEISQRISADALTTCPNCAKETFDRIVTGGAGVLYKGEGWYVTDYSKKSSGGKDSAAPTATPAPSAPEKTMTTSPAPAAAPSPATPKTE